LRSSTTRYDRGCCEVERGSDAEVVDHGDGDDDRVGGDAGLLEHLGECGTDSS
jgi:hypothetical protein